MKKYLGVIFNDKLSWKSHIQHVCSKLSNGSWALLKLRNNVDTKTLKTVYYALIYFIFNIVSQCGDWLQLLPWIH